MQHETRYDYADPVSVSHHLVRVTPRDLPGQIVKASHIAIIPAPPVPAIAHRDYFGNPVTSFTLQEPHSRMTVKAVSELEVHARPIPDFTLSPKWERVRESLPANHSADGLAAYQFVFDSSRSAGSAKLSAYALASFSQDRPFLLGVLDLTRRIHEDFQFDPKATEVNTPTENRV